MKTRILQLLTTLALAGFSSLALAVQVEVEDVSNKVITCDHANPFLAQQPAGACWANPEATLMVTVKLEAKDPANALDNIHVVIQSNGENFQYNTQPDGTEEGAKLWKKININGLVGTPPLVSSFQRGSLDTDPSSITRQVSLGEFYHQAGAKVYVGVRANDSAGFTADGIKEVFEVR